MSYYTDADSENYEYPQNIMDLAYFAVLSYLLNKNSVNMDPIAEEIKNQYILDDSKQSNFEKFPNTRLEVNKENPNILTIEFINPEKSSVVKYTHENGINISVERTFNTVLEGKDEVNRFNVVENKLDNTTTIECKLPNDDVLTLVYDTYYLLGKDYNEIFNTNGLVLPDEEPDYDSMLVTDISTLGSPLTCAEMYADIKSEFPESQHRNYICVTYYSSNEKLCKEWNIQNGTEKILSFREYYIN